MKSKVTGVNYVPLLNTEDSGFVRIQSIKFEATQHCKQQYFKVPPKFNIPRHTIQLCEIPSIFSGLEGTLKQI